MDCTPAIREAFRDAGIAVAWVFGSRATGRAHASSDIDVAVLRATDRPPLGLLTLSRLAHDLEPHLAAPVDVTDFERAPLELQARIVIQGQVLCSDDEPLRVRATVDAQSRWEDVRPALREMDRGYLTTTARRAMTSGDDRG